jgi:hypothetical protein
MAEPIEVEELAGTVLSLCERIDHSEAQMTFLFESFLQLQHYCETVFSAYAATLKGTADTQRRHDKSCNAAKTIDHLKETWRVQK